MPLTVARNKVGVSNHFQKHVQSAYPDNAQGNRVYRRALTDNLNPIQRHVQSVGCSMAH